MPSMYANGTQSASDVSTTISVCISLSSLSVCQSVSLSKPHIPLRVFPLEAPSHVFSVSVCVSVSRSVARLVTVVNVSVTSPIILSLPSSNLRISCNTVCASQYNSHTMDDTTVFGKTNYSKCITRAWAQVYNIYCHHFDDTNRAAHSL